MPHCSFAGQPRQPVRLELLLAIVKPLAKGRLALMHRGSASAGEVMPVPLGFRERHLQQAGTMQLQLRRPQLWDMELSETYCLENSAAVASTGGWHKQLLMIAVEANTEVPWVR